MDDCSITADEAAAVIGISGLELRNRLRAERPSGAIQVPDRKNGRWYLAPWFVEELAAEYGHRVVLSESAPRAAAFRSGPADQQVPVADSGHRVWSEWVPFSLALQLAPRFPGVYMVRVDDEPEAGPVYIGMAGERKGNGVRGRLAIYARGRGATSGLGEHAMDRALADPVWLRARLGEALEVRWQTVTSRTEASALEAQLITEYSGRLWNR